MSGMSCLSAPSKCSTSDTARVIASSAADRCLLDAAAAARAAASGKGRILSLTVAHSAIAGQHTGIVTYHCAADAVAPECCIWQCGASGHASILLPVASLLHRIGKLEGNCNCLNDLDECMCESMMLVSPLLQAAHKHCRAAPTAYCNRRSHLTMASDACGSAGVLCRAASTSTVLVWALLRTLGRASVRKLSSSAYGRVAAGQLPGSMAATTWPRHSSAALTVAACNMASGAQ